MPGAVVSRIRIQHDGQHPSAMCRPDHEHGALNTRTRISEHDAIAVADLTNFLGANVMTRELLNGRLRYQQDGDQHSATVRQHARNARAGAFRSWRPLPVVVRSTVRAGPRRSRRQLPRALRLVDLTPHPTRLDARGAEIEAMAPMARIANQIRHDRGRRRPLSRASGVPFDAQQDAAHPLLLLDEGGSLAYCHKRPTIPRSSRSPRPTSVGTAPSSRKHPSET